MHPAPSIIVFTTLSGAGFGLMAVLALGLAGLGQAGFLFAAVLALALCSAGLIASLFHLGHPERAWRALSQWRSSWLSREGVLSIATLTAFGILAGARLLLGIELTTLGLLTTILCAATVYATAMIYASLRAVPLWHSWLTPLCYLLFSAAGGMLLIAGIAASAGAPTAVLEGTAVLLLAVAWATKALWWRSGKLRGWAGSTPETATGLGAIGRVRLFEAPHTSPNYLMKEMVFRIGRRHARRLRAIAIAAGGVLPAVLILLSLSVGTAWPLLLLAAITHLVGLLAERWLFFAEARHAVGLYYGQGERQRSPHRAGEPHSLRH